MTVISPTNTTKASIVKKWMWL